MNSEKIFDALTDIREEFIAEAKEHKLHRPRVAIVRICAIAASFALVIGIGGFLILNGWLPTPGGSTGGGGGRADGSTTFMSYAGPVFPLSVLGDAEGITATRDITFDFSGFGEWPRMSGGLALHPSDIRVSDNYILTNNTASDKTARILYPFAGSFSELMRLIPSIAADGIALDAELYAGPYSGGFSGIQGLEDMLVNLRGTNSWDVYEVLLSDGHYLSRALGDVIMPDKTVIVYEFSNLRADFDKGVAPALAISMDLDYDRTKVMTYMFNGGEWDAQNDFMRLGFFVRREGTYRYSGSHYMIVIGDDVSEMSIQGYQSLAWPDGEEMEITADVRRFEAAFGDVLALLFNEFMAEYYEFMPVDGPSAGFDYDMEILLKSALELLLDYGMLADNIAWRYERGMLDDVFSEVLVIERVFYLAADITIPAGESIAVNVDMVKQGSFDFYGWGSGNEGLYGYDMVTRVGSTLVFQGLTAGLNGAEHIEIIRQNFGFDLANGIVNVTLDINEPHYYMEVRGTPRTE